MARPLFELAAGHEDRPFHDKHAGPRIFSFTAHIAVIATILGTFLFVTDNLPEVPVMMAFVADPATPQPPPPPPAPRPARAPVAENQPAPKPIPANSETFAVPIEAPASIQTDNSLLADTEVGVPGGVEGGIPGGVVGGMPGLVEDIPPPPPNKTPVRVGGDIRTPTLLHRVEPVYPQIAVNAKVAGIVILEATVDEKGNVTDVAVLRSLPLLDKAGIAAVRQWRYEPLMMNGVAYPFMLTVTLTFSIR